MEVQSALRHQSPIQALKAWQQKKPELFVKRVYEQTGLDSFGVMGMVPGDVAGLNYMAAVSVSPLFGRYDENFDPADPASRMEA